MPFFFLQTLIALRGANKNLFFPLFSPVFIGLLKIFILVEPFYASAPQFVCHSLAGAQSSLWEKKKAMTSSVYSSSFIYGYLHISLHNNDYPSQPHHALVSGSTNDVAEESFPPRVSSCQTYSKTADINTLMIELSFTVGLRAYTDLVSFRRDPFII